MKIIRNWLIDNYNEHGILGMGVLSFAWLIVVLCSLGVGFGIVELIIGIIRAI